VKTAKVCLIPLERSLGARHIFLLKDSIVGYATMLGDDTFPHLTDWRTGVTILLCPALYSNCAHLLFGDIHSICHAMWIWRNHVFVVLNYSVDIFTLPSLGSLLPSPSYHFGCQSLYFPMIRDDCDSGWIGEAFVNEFHQLPLEIIPNGSESSLRITIRDRSRDQVHYVTTLNQSPEDLGFYLEASTSGRNAVRNGTLKFCVGISNEYQLRLSCAFDNQYPAILELMRITRLPARNVERKSVLSTSGLPVLDSTTTMDFDDAAGVILLGSCRGEICVIQFSFTNSHARGSLIDDLPSVRHGLSCFPRSPIPTNLPYCYYLTEKIHERIVPSIVREEALKGWNKGRTFPKVVPPSGWSSDWRGYPSIHNWVLPFPRWRTLAVDRVFHVYETWNRVVRARIGTRGDIVPIMYCERKDDFVIFKIAQRVYYFNGGPFGEDDEPRIWALPYSEQDLSDPAVLAEIYRNRWRHSGPLDIRGYDNAGTTLLRINEEYLRLLDFLKTADGRVELSKRSLAEDPRTWSSSDRGEIRGIVNWVWRGSHRRMNDIRDDDDDDDDE